MGDAEVAMPLEPPPRPLLARHHGRSSPPAFIYRRDRNARPRGPLGLWLRLGAALRAAEGGVDQREREQEDERRDRQQEEGSAALRDRVPGGDDEGDPHPEQ